MAHAGRGWVWLGIAVLLGAVPVTAKVETWKQDSQAAFSKGRKERVVVSSAGRVRLARALRPTADLDAARVWDLVQTPDGALFAATGDGGKVFRREGPERPWTVVFDAPDTQVLSLAVLSDGRVVAGTGPSGQVVDLTDPKHPASRPDPGVQYIWDLAADSDGNLFAATGPTGQLWKRSAAGAWSLLLDSPHPHLLCLARGADGAVFAGSDGAGLVYRVAHDGKVSVLHDAPQDEVRALALAPDGSLYAGTAATESGGGSASATTSATSTTASATAPASGSVTGAKPPAAGENAVYHITAEGAVREVFRAKTMVFALAWQADRLLVGTGPEGQLFEVREDGRESAPIARLDSGQVLSLLAGPGQEVWLGAGDPGAVQALGPGLAAAGSLTTTVLDAKLISRFGSLSWRADRPAGTSVGVQARTGNVGEPDETWSAWSPLATEPESPAIAVPPARFAQLRIQLETKDPHSSPALRAVALRYQTLNLAPEITRIEVPDLTEADGTARPATIAVKWDAADPNGDDLAYTLHVRKDDWPDWVPIHERALTEKSLSWDSTTLPAGTYRLRVAASDRPSNPPAQALARELVSEPFVVDHQAPVVTVQAQAGEKVTATVQDALTRPVKAAYALDAGEWTPIFPADGLFDQLTETLTIRLENLRPGRHVLRIRATDAAGNTGAGDAVFESK